MSGGFLRHSVFDRLTSGNRQVNADFRISVHELKLAVRRDIEWLLNSKKPIAPPLDDFPESQTSILGYGLPDFTQYSGSSLGDCQAVCRLVTEAIKNFEPRMLARSVRVEHVPVENGNGMFSKFRINGIISVDPIKEAVSFDTDIEMDSGSVEITVRD